MSATPSGAGLCPAWRDQETTSPACRPRPPPSFPKPLEFLKEAVPSASGWRSGSIRRIPARCWPMHGWTARPGPWASCQSVSTCERRADLDAAFAGTLKQHAEALLVYPLPIPLRDFQRIAEFAMKNRLPAIALFPQIAREGVLMSYGPDQAEQYRRVGTYIDKILKGAEPTDLPVETPRDIRARDQPEDRQGPWADHLAVAAAASQRSNPMS